MPGFNGTVGNGGNGKRGVGIREAILGGVIAFAVCAGAMFLIINGLIQMSSPYVKDKQFIMEAITANRMATEENKNDLKSLNKNMTDLTIEIRTMNVQLGQLLDDDRNNRHRGKP